MYKRVKKILANSIDTNRRRQIADRYRHNYKSWSQDLKLEVADFFKRHNVQIDELLDDWPDPSWSEGTEDRTLNRLFRHFGFMSSRRKLGPNIPVGNISMAWFAVPQLTDESAKFAVGRRSKKDGKSVVLPDELGFMNFGKSMVVPDSWLRHRPDLAAKLVPIEGLLTKADCQEARADWEQFLDRAVNQYERKLERIRRHVAKPGTGRANNPKMKIAPALNGDTLGFLEHLPRKLSQNARRYAGYAGAFKLRDFIIGAVEAQLFQRSRAARSLTWRPDNTGHLRKLDGAYLIVAPRESMKNRDSSIFVDEKEIRFELIDADGLFAAFDAYLAPGGGRSILLNGKESDLLFVKRSPTAAYDAKQFWRCFRQLSGCFFAGEEGKPWEDIRAIGPHLIRQLGFTAVRKETGSYKKAADALLITEAVGLKSYNWETPSERAKGTKEVLLKRRRSGRP